MSLDKEFLRLQKQIERMTKHKEATVARNHKKVLDDLRFRLAKLYESYEIDGQLTFDEVVKYNRLQKLDKEVETLIKDLYKDNANLTRGHLKAIAEDTYNNTITMVGKVAKKELKGIKKTIDVTKTINESMARLKWIERMGKHRNDVIWDIQKEIKQGLTQGDTYGTMAKRLKKELEISTSKSNTIIRTESARVHAKIKEESLDNIAKQGVKMTKTWLSSQDERVRSSHADMNGVTVSYNDDFTLPGGYKAKIPMDDRLPAGEVINCRCIITIDLEKDSGISEDIGYNDSEETNLQLFAEKDLDKQKVGSINKGIRSYNKRIIEHEDKIKNPRKYVPDWDTIDIREQKGLIKHWNKEISNFNKSIRIRIDELKKRGEMDE